MMDKLALTFSAESIPRIAFFTPENQGIFGNNLVNILYVVMPLLLIWLAIEYGGQLIEVIRDAFSRMTDRDNDRYTDDDDED